MTKEEIAKSVPVMHIDYNNKDCVRLDDVLKFLDSYVCIPKGENKNIIMYADIDDKYSIFSDGRLLNKHSGRFTKCVEHSHGYIRVYVNCVDTYLHRLVAEYFCDGKTDERCTVNHKDGNKKNNNYTNLEWVSYQENQQHALDEGLSGRGVKRKHNKSGYVGVQFHKGTGKYQAQISVNGKNQYLGLFSTAEDAAIAYNSASLLMYGNKQNINEVIK